MKKLFLILGLDYFIQKIHAYIYIFKKLCLAVDEPIAYVFLRHPHYSPLKKREQNKI